MVFTYGIRQKSIATATWQRRFVKRFFIKPTDQASAINGCSDWCVERFYSLRIEPGGLVFRHRTMARRKTDLQTGRRPLESLLAVTLNKTVGRSTCQGCPIFASKLRTTQASKAAEDRAYRSRQTVRRSHPAAKPISLSLAAAITCSRWSTRPRTNTQPGSEGTASTTTATVWPSKSA